MAVLAVVIPFAILRVSIEYDALAELAEMILYLYPIYLPVFCGLFGVTMYKETGKILLPTLIFNLFLIFGTCYLTAMIFNAIEGSLADSLIGLILFGPMVYSIPISFIATAIYKHKKKKTEVQKNNEDDTINETQI